MVTKRKAVTLHNFGTEFDVPKNSIVSRIQFANDAGEFEELINQYDEFSQAQGHNPSWRALLVALSEANGPNDDSAWLLTEKICERAAGINMGQAATA